MHNRRQLLLQQMGIQQWIPRQQATVYGHSAVLWRDEQLQSADTVDADLFQTTQLSPPQVKTRLSDNIQPSPIQSQTQPIKPADHSEYHEEFIEKEPIFSQNIRFQYIVLLHAQFILLTTVEDAPQQQLLRDLQKVTHSQWLQLNWPLDLPLWKWHDGWVNAYLAGFFTVHQDKKIIVLGDNHLSKYYPPLVDRATTAPSLAQMQQDAQYKRQLWYMLQPLLAIPAA